MVTSVSDLSPSCLLHITDCCNGRTYLLDTGAEVNVLPSSHLAYLNLCECLSASRMLLKHSNVSLTRYCEDLIFLYGYIDDLLVASKDPEEHKNNYISSYSV